MRSSIADFQIIEALPPAVGGGARFACHPPARLNLADPAVIVSELSVEAGQWKQLVELLVRLNAVESDHLQYLFEVGPDPVPDGQGAYLAGESAPGGTISEAVEALSVPDRIQRICEAARGAHALHEAGIAHGSIGAHSILLGERGAVLSPPDMGLSPGFVTRVRDWQQLATVDPELLRGERPSRASDVWSLGATLHILLSSRPLYPGIDKDPPVTAVQRVLFTRPETDPDLPVAVAQVIASCLDDDPGNRPATARELADHLLGLEVSR